MTWRFLRVTSPPKFELGGKTYLVYKQNFYFAHLYFYFFYTSEQRFFAHGFLQAGTPHQTLSWPCRYFCYYSTEGKIILSKAFLFLARFIERQTNVYYHVGGNVSVLSWSFNLQAISSVSCSWSDFSLFTK